MGGWPLKPLDWPILGRRGQTGRFPLRFCLEEVMSGDRCGVYHGELILDSGAV